MSNLAKPFLMQLEVDQEKALIVLKGFGYGKLKFIRMCVDYYLYANYRSILKESRKLAKNENLPDFVK